jgi:hypothetical protein
VLFLILSRPLESIPTWKCSKRSSDGRKTLIGRMESMKGRVVYGDFINPDTRSATQEAAQQSAAVDAAQRRSKRLRQVQLEETNTTNLGR